MSVHEIDCRGLPCPRPVIELHRAIAELQPGDQVAVAADDPAAATDIAAFCRMRGHRYVAGSPAADGVPVHLVTKLS